MLTITKVITTFFHQAYCHVQVNIPRKTSFCRLKYPYHRLADRKNTYFEARKIIQKFNKQDYWQSQHVFSTIPMNIQINMWLKVGPANWEYFCVCLCLYMCLCGVGWTRKAGREIGKSFTTKMLLEETGNLVNAMLPSLRCSCW